MEYDGGSVKVSVIGCDHVADFIKAVKNEFSPDLDTVSVARISIHLPGSSDAIDPKTPMSDFIDLCNASENYKNSIVVKTNNGKL